MNLIEYIELYSIDLNNIREVCAIAVKNNYSIQIVSSIKKIVITNKKIMIKTKLGTYIVRSKEFKKTYRTHFI